MAEQIRRNSASKELENDEEEERMQKLEEQRMEHAVELLNAQLAEDSVQLMKANSRLAADLGHAVQTVEQSGPTENSMTLTETARRGLRVGGAAGSVGTAGAVESTSK